VQIQRQDGTLIDVAPRSASGIPGGTAAKANEGIGWLFRHSSCLLKNWIKTHEEIFGAGSWTGPPASAIGLHRLGASCVIMSDTCNKARATRKLLREDIAVAVQDSHRPAQWAALDEAEQARRATSVKGHCTQYMRNIMLDAMSAAANKHLNAALVDTLQQFGLTRHHVCSPRARQCCAPESGPRRGSPALRQGVRVSPTG